MAGLCKLVGACKLFELDVSGFKSLKKVKVTFPDSLTIVVGSNGSGKTALIEVFELLKELLRWKRKQIVNPFLKWWGYRNVVWARQENLPITIRLKLNIQNIPDAFSKLKEEQKQSDLSLFRRLSEGSSIIDYEIEIMKNKITSINERLSLNEFGMKVIISNGRMKFIIRNRPMFEETIRRMERKVERELTDILKGKKKLTEFTFFDILYVLPGLTKQIRFDGIKLASELKKFQKMNQKTQFRYLSSFLKESLQYMMHVIEGKVFAFELGYESLIDLGIEILKEAKGEISNFIEPAWEEIRENLLYNILSLLKKKIQKKDFPAIRMLCLLKFLREFVTEVALIISCSATLIVNYLERSIILKPLNYGKIKSLTIKSYAEELDIDCSNLINFLYTITNGTIPEHVLEIIKEIWNVKDLEISFEDLPYGYISLRFNVEGITVSQISAPEGIWKALAIEAATLFEPTIIAIDEFENSLHARAQDLLLEELRNSNALSIITTHSTIPLDFAKSPNEILVIELINGETKSWRLSEIDAIKKKLEELGLTISEGLLHRFVTRG